jgi:hypothetical protein
MAIDIRQFLAEDGLSKEEIDALVGSPATAKAMTRALSRFEEGSTALTQAQQQSAETAQYWEDQTKKLEGTAGRLTAAERRAAQAEALAAQRTAYLKSLKDQGYDVPDEYLGAPTNTPPKDPATGQFMTREDLDRAARATAPDLIAITALAAEFSELFGKPYREIENDFEAARQAGKPLRQFAHSKYNFEGERAKKAQAADQARIDAIVGEQMKVKEAEMAARYGSNPDLRAPMPSKFDRLITKEGVKEDSWKSSKGREQNRAERLKRFENMQIQ